MTDTLTHLAPPPTRTSPPAVFQAAAGIAAALLTFTGLHSVHPPGAPEHLSDAQVIGWARPATAQLWAGGSFSIVAALLLLVFAQGWAEQTLSWGAPAWAGSVTRMSVALSAAFVGLAGLWQISAAVGSLPSEHTAEPSLIATLVNLYGILGVSAWVFLLPAVATGLIARRNRPRWALVVSLIASIALLSAVVVPFLAWATGPAWLIAISLGCLLAPLRRSPAC